MPGRLCEKFLLGLFILICLQIFSRFSLTSMLGVFPPVWKSAPLLKSPNAPDTLKSFGIFYAALCSCHIGEPPQRTKGMLSECCLHPRGCTTHSLPSQPLKYIRATWNMKTHPDAPSFSGPSVQPLPPVRSRAEPSSGNIKLVTIGALSINIQSHAKADYVAMCLPHVGMFWATSEKRDHSSRELVTALTSDLGI